MYATICKQNNNSDHQIVKFNVNGFTGIFNGWQDNVLTSTQQNEILNAIKTETDPATNTVVHHEDAVYTLVQTIIYHFIGIDTVSSDRSRELLQKLRCPSLTHIHWYNDVFLMKVMQRPDRNNERRKSCDSSAYLHNSFTFSSLPNSTY